MASHDDLLRWGTQRSAEMRVSAGDAKTIHRVLMARRRAYQNRKSAKLSANKNKANALRIVVLQKRQRVGEIYSRSMYANYLQLEARASSLAGFRF